MKVSCLNELLTKGGLKNTSPTDNLWPKGYHHNKSFCMADVIEANGGTEAWDQQPIFLHLNQHVAEKDNEDERKKIGMTGVPSLTIPKRNSVTATLYSRFGGRDA